MNNLEIGNVVRLKSQSSLDLTVVKINSNTVDCMYFCGLTMNFKTIEIPQQALTLIKK